MFNPAAATPNQPPVAVNDSGFATARNTAATIQTSALLANDTDPNGDALTVASVGNPTNGTVALNSNKTVTFTPAANYTGAAGFSYTASDGRGGVSSATVSLTVTAPSTAVSLFSQTATPAVTSANDPAAVELGMKFTASSGGTISGIRYYKGPQDAGTHTGTLWSSTGTQLARATFTSETASGWQTVNFASPVAITAGTTYVASYHSNGFYAADSNYFASAISNGPLTAPASDASGGNGVYAYGSASLFPTNTFNRTNFDAKTVDGLIASGAITKVPAGGRKDEAVHAEADIVSIVRNSSPNFS